MNFKLLLVISLCLLIFMSYRYYLSQNKKPQIGGPIAKPKIYWLGFTFYNYFALSVLLWWGLELSNEWKHLLLIFIGFIYFRALVQSMFMFVFHIWTPPMGIFYNLLCFGIIGTYAFLHAETMFIWVNHNTIAALYFALIMCLLITDTVYAYLFYQIVGTKTKGKAAIWYASEHDPVFRKVVQLTRNLNMMYSLYYCFLLSRIFAL